jgi:hypothetical protein
MNGGMNRVVSLVDSGVRSERGVRVAAALAARLGRDLTLMTANPAPFGAYVAERHEALAAIAGATPGIRGIESVLVESFGLDATAILRSVDATDILVLAADKVRVLGELLEGSIFMNVVRLFPGVVVAVGPSGVLPASADSMLLCVDGESQEYGRLLTEFADPLGLRDTVVTVEPANVKLPPDLVDGGAAAATARQFANRTGHQVEWETLHGDPAKVISAAADTNEVAFVGMVTMAVGPIGRLLYPSLTNELLARCPRPLVLLSEPPHRTAHVHRPHDGSTVVSGV